MTARKPPEPNKTLVGMPSDVRAVLEKLDQATPQQPARADQSGEHARPGVVASRTTGQTGQSPRSSPPPLPVRPQSQPPPLPSRRSPQPSARSVAPAPDASVPLDRTLTGMPADMHAVLQHALSDQAPAPPRPAASQPSPPLIVQPVRTIGGPSAAPIEAQVEVQVPAHVRAPAVSPSRPAPVPQPMVAAEPYGHAPTDAAPPIAHAGSPSVQPDPAVKPVEAGWPSEAFGASTTAASPAYSSTQLAVGPQSSAAPSAAPDLAADGGSRLALPLPEEAPKRPTKNAQGGWWNRGRVVALLAVAVVALGGGTTLWLSQSFVARSAAVVPPQPGPAAVDSPVVGAQIADRQTDQTAQEAPGALHSAQAINAATDPAAAKDAPPVATDETVAPVPAAPTVIGAATAELEKKAIEQLMGHDYPAAKQLYEQLRAAEPARTEYSMMIELLNRAVVTPCGQPGQAPCVGR